MRTHDHLAFSLNTAPPPPTPRPTYTNKQANTPYISLLACAQAAKVARDALVASALDHGSDPEAFRKDLINIARTTLSSKILTTSKQFFSDLAVNAVMRLKGKNNLEGIQIIKILGGALTDSYLDEVRAIVPLARMPFVHTS
jgi:hypothetical protein